MPVQAEQADKMETAEDVMRRNADQLTERQPPMAVPPPMWLNMIAPVGLPAEQRPRSPRAHSADIADAPPRPVRCNIM
jgi:hypothetical protein